MGVRDRTLELLFLGDTPGQIAKKMGVSIKTTLAYLDQMVGEGRVRRSDILLTIPAHRRLRPTNPDDSLVVSKYGQVSHLLGDVYEDVRFVEKTLHIHIRKVLEDQYGLGEKGWWRKGIPESIRKECQIRREEDEDTLDPYCYTDLIDLRTTIEKQWATIGPTLPNKLSSDKKQFMEDLLHINRIRRMVMHPVRGNIPSEEDFDFLKAMRRNLQVLE